MRDIAIRVIIDLGVLTAIVAQQKHFIWKFVIVVCLTVFGIAGNVPAAGEAKGMPQKIQVTPGGALENYLDELRYFELQSEAAIVDMHLYLGWQPDNKKGIRKASKKAVADLNRLKEKMKKLAPPESCREVTSHSLDCTDFLINLYTGFDEKDKEHIAKLNRKWDKMCLAYLAKFRKFSRQQNNLDASEPEPEFLSDKDKKNYQQAAKFMEEKHYQRAMPLLESLREKYPGHPFVLLDLSDCLAKTGFGKAKKKSPEEESLKILDKIIFENRYSPVLAEAWLKWRTLSQSHLYGVSNYSEIPNREYNEKRFKLLRTIRAYINKHSNDQWARRQERTLLIIPNILRGGTMGNSNLTWWGILYGMDGFMGDKQ